MSELKYYKLRHIVSALASPDFTTGVVFDNHDEVYYKSEADKVIAELEEKHKTEVKELLCLIRDKENNFNRAFDSEEKEIRHHKYKRCLAMALVWFERAENSTDWKNELVSRKRCSKWLEIAEKFKEAKAPKEDK